jgi:redox-sensitive bicupin YhaK (pirin superfamily)
MITLRKAEERRVDRKRQAWLMFHARDRKEAWASTFAALELFAEYRLSPGAVAPRQPSQDAETITYVREGALIYENGTGARGVIGAGEFQRLTCERGVKHSETNASRTYGAHVFRFALRAPGEALAPGHQEKRFSAAERRGVLRVVASPDARLGSLQVHQDVLVFSAIMFPGQHLVHELTDGRRAWVHAVHGEVKLGDLLLGPGDGAAVVSERAASFTTHDDAEVLLLDFADPESPAAVRSTEHH